jgi:hypothetical protein
MKFVNYIDITPTWGSYQTVDLSAHFGSDAGSVAGVYLLAHAAGGGADTFAIGKTGQTGSRLGYRVESSSGMAKAWCGCDSNDCIDINITVSTTKVYLIGYYLTSEAVFLDTYVEKTIASASAWTDINISTDTGANTAIAAILQIYDAASRTQVGVRKNGSSTGANLYGQIYAAGGHCRIVAVDGSEILEGWTNSATSTTTKYRLIGYLTANFTDLDAVLKGASSTVWEWIDLNGAFTNNIGINGIYWFMKTSTTASLKRAINSYRRDFKVDENALLYRGSMGGWTPIDRILKLQQSCGNGASDDLVIVGVSTNGIRTDKPLHKIRA